MINLIRRSKWLFESTPESGKYNPWLAEFEWPKTADRGVSSCARGQFHHGYGEFTAKDVLQSPVVRQIPSRKDPPTWVIKCICGQGVSGQRSRVVIHCVVCLDMLFYYSSASTVVMFSKAQWDKEEMSYETKYRHRPYIFKERQPDRYVLYERPHATGSEGGGLERAQDDLTIESRRVWRNSWQETHLTELNKISPMKR